MQCWKCGQEKEDPPMGRLPFRATCEACSAYLHCCRNCIYYQPGLPNDCRVPGTEYIADREAGNLCEEFKLLGKGPTAQKDLSDVSKQLFGEEVEDSTDKDPKRRFDDLFS